MRLSSIFVVLVAAFLVSCNATSTTSERKSSTPVQPLDIPVKNTRSLRKIKTEEEESSKLEERAAMGDILKNFKRSTSYLNHPLLRPQAEVLAAAKKADEILESKLLKDKELVKILKKIKTTSGAKTRIQDWVERGVDPVDIATMYKKKYPTLKRDGVEWTAQRLYSALVLKNVQNVVNLG
ncbi:hypothetical protein P3T76_010639 [Phytophthora citrophthora]|uniref:RxLR effector protein n=1 Tax=Phytophthora citrophthora TaxID=4793 RepID=A0AAD9GBN1_9STRA|nr:hypothetical protein P3T76_010639 [Phytophthora citrophthora]